MNPKLHAVTDAQGRQTQLFMTAGQVSGYTGTAAVLRATFPQRNGCWRIEIMFGRPKD